jgi:hypothetical protein
VFVWLLVVASNGKEEAKTSFNGISSGTHNHRERKEKLVN